MKSTAASKTAQYMALFRALETRRPKNKRLFTDSFAVSFLDKNLQLATKLTALPFGEKLVQRIIYNKIPGAFSSGIARTKYIDDLLEKSVKAGVKQVIILGAGFDTRALRLPFLQNVPVIEIDHPNTSRMKTSKVQERLGKLPAHVRYFQIDFNKQSIHELAAQQNIDFSIPTTIIWEGVTNYLSAEAIDTTFAFVKKFTAGSYIIFTYVHKEVLDKPSSFYGAEKLLSDLDALEEKWTFGFYPQELQNYLSQYNIQLLEDAGAAEYRSMYMPERNEKGYEFYRVAFGRITE